MVLARVMPRPTAPPGTGMRLVVYPNERSYAGSAKPIEPPTPSCPNGSEPGQQRA